MTQRTRVMTVLWTVTVTATAFAVSARAEGDLSFRQAAETLARRTGARILVEPAISQVLLRRWSDDGSPLEPALTRICARAGECEWAHLDWKPGGGRLATASRLAKAVRALLGQPHGWLFEQITPGGKAVVVAPDSPLTPPRGAVEVYLLYRTTSPSQDSAGIEDLTDEQLALMETLSPQETPSPMRAWMEALQGLGQERTERVVAPLAAAGQRLWDSTPPDQRSQLLQDSMKVAQTYGGGLTPGKSEAAPSSPRNYLRELKAIAAALAKKHKVRIEVDPNLFISSPPAAPLDVPLEQALSALLEKERLVGWSRAHLAESAEHEPIAAALAAEARLWRAAGAEALIATAPRRGSLRQIDAPTEVESEIDRLGAGHEVVYVIYGLTDHRSLSPAARLADLLRRQMARLVSMTPDEATETMGSTIRSYMTAPTAERRQQIMALPAMAGMMAVWFPKAAQGGTLKP